MTFQDWKTDEVRELEDRDGVDAAWDPEKSGGISYSIRSDRHDAMDKVIATGRSTEEGRRLWQQHFGDLIDACERAKNAWLAKNG